MSFLKKISMKKVRIGIFSIILLILSNPTNHFFEAFQKSCFCRCTVKWPCVLKNASVFFLLKICRYGHQKIRLSKSNSTEKTFYKIMKTREKRLIL